MHNKTKKHRLLITGATGYIGRRLTHRLMTENGYDIRLLVRNRNKVQIGIQDKFEIFEGSTFDTDSLKRALTGVDTAYYLIHSMGSREDYQERDRISAENFRICCIDAGVKRIIYLGGLGVKGSASKHLLSRIETGEILSTQHDKIQTIWLRAGVIIGSGSASFEIVRNLCQKLPIMITPRWVRSKTQPIGIEAVLDYLTASIRLEQRGDLIVDIGSEALTFQQMIEQASEVMGLKRHLFPVPVLSPHLSSYWLILFTPIPYKLASALVAGLKSETVLQNDNASRYYPDIEPAPFKISVAAAIDEMEQNQVLSRWCDSSKGEACDIRDFDDPEGAILRDVRIIPYPKGKTQQDIFDTVSKLGGKTGWFRYDFLWRIRGLMDKVAGGYGLNRGRRSDTELRTGDALDFWKVVDLKPGKRLLLHAQMKVPGQAWLEFDIQPDQLVQTAHFLPKGVLGRLYWYSLVPLHYFIFKDMASSIVSSAADADETAI